MGNPSLDATASQNSVVALWDPGSYEIIPVPQPRRYQNVTLHIASIAEGIGKIAMVQHRDRRASQLHAFLDQASEPGDRWFVVSHKDVEPIIIKERTDPETCDYSVDFAHWGDVD